MKFVIFLLNIKQNYIVKIKDLNIRLLNLYFCEIIYFVKEFLLWVFQINIWFLINTKYIEKYMYNELQI